MRKFILSILFMFALVLTSCSLGSSLTTGVGFVRTNQNDG